MSRFTKDGAIKSVLRCLKKNMGTSMTIAEVARSIGVSDSTAADALRTASRLHETKVKVTNLKCGKGRFMKLYAYRMGFVADICFGSATKPINGVQRVGW